MTISTTRAVERCERLAKLGPPPVWWRVFKLRRWLAAYDAIMALDISAAAEILRSVYSTDAVAAQAERSAPTFAALSKAPRSERKP